MDRDKLGRFINGHKSFLTEESKEKISIALTGFERATKEEIIKNRKKRRMKYYYKNKEKELIRTKTLRVNKKPKKCSECDKVTDDLEAHHIKYTIKDIIWLCKTCHIKKHRKLNKG